MLNESELTHTPYCFSVIFHKGETDATVTPEITAACWPCWVCVGQERSRGEGQTTNKKGNENKNKNTPCQ